MNDESRYWRLSDSVEHGCNVSGFISKVKEKTMSEQGVEMVLGMARDLTEQYRRGYDAGYTQGKIEAFQEAINILKEKDHE